MGSRVRLIFVAELLAALAAVTTNVATNALPDSWQPYLWLAWPMLAVLIAVGIVLAVVARRADSVRSPGSPERTVYYRRAMVARLRRVWVDEALDRTLFRRTLVELGLTERPDLLQRSWDVVVDVPNEEPRPLDPDIALSDVLERHRALLVLGAPGAGKTTMLLAFLRDQLDQAEQDGIVPIPVVFQLASWATERKPMAEWLADELSGPHYGLPPDLARDWIAGDRVLPLLDGLDEVPLDHRLACARAIDAFHRSHRLLPLLVTSRSADYDALGLRLSLGAALVIKPLEPAQIDQHLSRLGEPLAGLRQAIRRRPPLAELLSSPFLLDVAIRAYHDLPTSEVPDRADPEHWQTTLFATFVNRALRRRKTGPELGASEVVRMLALIARALGQKLETSFFLESVDPTWLPERRRRVLKAATAIPAVILVGGAAGMLVGLVLGLLAGIAMGGLAAAVTAAALMLAPNPPLTYDGSGDWAAGIVHHLRNLAVGAVVAGVGSGLIAGLCGALLGIVAGLAALSAGGLFIDVFGTWAYVGAVAGALTGAVVSAVIKPDNSHRSALRGRAIGAGLLDTAWMWGIIMAATAVPATVVLGGAFGSPGLLAGLLLPLAFGYTHSGRSLLEYWITRILLARAEIIPLRLRPFLDLAVDRALLLRSGGGHMFLHRLLLEYFAGLEPPGVPDGYADSLPAVDLRPDAVLMRALEAARRRHCPDVLPMLAYAGSVLPPEVWATGAMRIVEAIEEQLDSITLSTPVSQAAAPDLVARNIYEHNLVAVGEMVIAAEHTELSLIAAIHLGKLLEKLFVNGPTPTLLDEAWLDELKPAVVKLLKDASASEDPWTASEAASTLARLKTSSRSGRDQPPPESTSLP